MPRPQTKEGAASEQLDERARRVQAAVAALTAGVSAERAQRSEEQQAKWLLAHLLDWHRREEKAPWWEFFRLRDLSDEELFEEKAAVSGLCFVQRTGGTVKCPIDRYTYPLQETDVRERDSLHLPDGIPFGEVEAIDRLARAVDVKKHSAQAEVNPTAVFAHSVINSKVLADALLRIADHVIRHGIVGETDFRVARQLLQAKPPRIRSGAFERRLEESELAFAARIATDLDNTILAIQGPPGAGKTHTAAEMICELVRSGARVGVTAVSHKVIRNLLDKAVKLANEAGIQMTCLHKVGDKSDSLSAIEETTDNADAMGQLRGGFTSLNSATEK